jgi:hypothetical protein
MPSVTEKPIVPNAVVPSVITPSVIVPNVAAPFEGVGSVRPGRRRFAIAHPLHPASSSAQISSIKACTQKRALWRKKNRAENLRLPSKTFSDA